MQRFNQKGASIFLVAHDANVATYADKVLLILDGRIKKEIQFDPATSQAEHHQLILAELNQIGI
ncbi:ABC transporter ATP-binding protein YvcR [Streptococcus sinensis]|uniref:ABC transporter ATP-binding protein YvcR n=1 Tax=Streptococcus sinensis TaxID=176090 RepID=A0A0A0DIG4_9STRE|nr:ABC transporter ATP-binding protein YvcR [Streptococcus sinensis]